jgi:CelD/BcsL family acetyltransferase involved in cellulose biosynthesis
MSKAVDKNEGDNVWMGSEIHTEWDSFVSQHSGALVYHLSAWRKVLEEAFSHIRGDVLVVRDLKSGQITAGLPVYSIKSWLLGKRIVSIPYASICDPLISCQEDLAKLMPQIRDLQKRTNAGYIEIRSMNNAGLVSSANLISNTGYKHNYIQLNGSIDDVFFRCSRNVRRLVKGAQKSLMAVETDESESALELFYEMLTATRRRLAIPPLPYCFFTAIWRHLFPQFGTLFLGSQNDRILGGLLVLHFKRFWVAEYICDLGSYESKDIKHLLYWEAIKMAHAQGAEVFSFGRTSTESGTLLAYKRKWGTVEEELADFRFSLATNEVENIGIEQNRESRKTYRLIRSLCRVAPLPLYNVIGRFCYRHMG